MIWIIHKILLIKQYIKKLLKTAKVKVKVKVKDVKVQWIILDIIIIYLTKKITLQLQIIKKILILQKL